MQNNNQYILQFSREIKISLKKYKRSECNNKVQKTGIIQVGEFVKTKECGNDRNSV